MNTELLAKYNVTPFANPAETEYFAKYLAQGERKGLEGLANVVYARTQTSELFKTLPHLKDKYKDQVVKVSQPIKVVKVKQIKADKALLVDGSVFYRADRAKWMAVYNGKAEAARPTKEAALAFLKKKYGVDGYVI